MVFALVALRDELERIRAKFYAVYCACMWSGEVYLQGDWVATPLLLMFWFWSERGMYGGGRGIYSSMYYLRPMQSAVAVALITPGAASTQYNALNYASYYPPVLSVKSSPEEGGAYLHIYRFIEVEYAAKAEAAITGEADWEVAMYLTRKYETWGITQPTSVVV